MKNIFTEKIQKYKFCVFNIAHEFKCIAVKKTNLFVYFATFFMKQILFVMALKYFHFTVNMNKFN